MRGSIKTVARVFAACQALNELNGYCGVTAYTVARSIGISPRLATYHLKRLTRSGDVESVRVVTNKSVDYVVLYAPVRECD